MLGRDKPRNGPGSLTVPLQETGNFWGQQQRGADCEETRGGAASSVRTHGMANKAESMRNQERSLKTQ